MHSTVAPVAIGRDARDIAKLSRDLQQELHLFGRYGITIFALSGLDIALWDIAGKAANLPLHRLLGGAGQASLPAYASLLKYRDPERVAARTKLAIQQGYRHIKLHETEEAEVRAAREAAGHDVTIMVDTNCPWTPEEARHMTLEAQALRPALARGTDLSARGLRRDRPAARRHRRGHRGGREQLHVVSVPRHVRGRTPSTTPSPASPRWAA